MLRALFKSGLSVTLLRGANVLFGFAILLILSRALGPEGLGAYAYATTVLLLLGTPVSYGWAPMLLREAARALHEDKWQNVKGMARRGSQLSFVVSALGLSSGLLAINFFPSTDTSQTGLMTTTVVVTLSIVLLFDQLSALRTSLLRGLGRAVSGQIPEMLVKPASQIVILILAAAALASDLNAQTALLALAAATIIGFVVGAIILRQSSPPELIQAAPHFDHGPWAHSFALFASSAAISLLNASADLLLLGMLRGAAEVGYYKVALQVALAGALAYTSLNMIAVQRFATAHASGDRVDLQLTATHLARLALVPAIIVFLMLLLAGDQLVPWAFGSDFAPSLLPMLVLSSAQIVNAGAGMGRSLLMMSGHETKAMFWAAIGLGANILFCLALIPHFGATGAAIGHAVSLLLWNVGIWWTTRRTNEIDASALGWSVPNHAKKESS